jgi:hypothetical protein
MESPVVGGDASAAQILRRFGFLKARAVAMSSTRPLVSVGSNSAADWEEHVETLLADATSGSAAALDELVRLELQFAPIAKLALRARAAGSTAFDPNVFAGADVELLEPVVLVA